MTMHSMKLNLEPFEMIKNGSKTIECRLFDGKRQKIIPGDNIIFTNVDTGETLKVIVIGLLRYKTFEEMFNRHDPKLFGGESSEELTKSLLGYYSLEKQQQYSVLGIDIQKDNRAF